MPDDKRSTLDELLAKARLLIGKAAPAPPITPPRLPPPKPSSSSSADPAPEARKPMPQPIPVARVSVPAPAPSSNVVPLRSVVPPQDRRAAEQLVLDWDSARRVFFLAGVRKATGAAIAERTPMLAWSREHNRYQTGVPLYARRLEQYATPAARAAFAAFDLAERMSDAADAPAGFSVPTPDGLELLPYQESGVRYILDHSNALCGDEMGLGKTPTTYAVINAEPAIRRVAVFCPAFLVTNWLREAERWLTRPLTVGRAQKGVLPTTDIVVLSYDGVAPFMQALRSRPWDMMVCDEAHYLKNPNAARTRRILGGTVDAKAWDPVPATRRLFLTGTPLLNRPNELWSLVHALDPVAWPESEAAFVRRYGNQPEWSSNLRELNARLRQTTMVRRLKREVLKHLPPKTRQVIEVPPTAAAAALMAREQQAFEYWQTAKREVRALRSRKATLTDAGYRAQLGTLKAGRAAAWALLSRLRHDVGRAKADWVIAHLEDALEQGGKILCFVHHRDVGQRISQAFGTRAVLVNGQMTAAAKQDAVDRFQDPSSGLDLWVGSIKASGVGLTLTASAHVVFAELDWTPGVLSQAEDRTHRIGQLNAVLVQHIVLEGSLDANMCEKLIAKQVMCEHALNVRPEDVIVEDTEADETFGEE